MGSGGLSGWRLGTSWDRDHQGTSWDRDHQGPSWRRDRGVSSSVEPLEVWAEGPMPRGEMKNIGVTRSRIETSRAFRTPETASPYLEAHGPSRAVPNGLTCWPRAALRPRPAGCRESAKSSWGGGFLSDVRGDGSCR